MIRFKINLAFVLVAANAWVYVGYAAASGQSNIIDVITTIFISILCASYCFLFNNEQHTIRVVIEKRVVIQLALFIFTAVIIIRNRLSEDISGDQLYYANYAFIHTLKIYEYLNSVLLSNVDLSIKAIIQFLNLVVLFFCFLTIIFLRRFLNNKILLSIIVLIFVLVGRFAIIKILSGSSYIQPPLQLLPNWLSGTIFGLSNFSFRLPALLSLIITFFILQRVIRDNTKFVALHWLLPLMISTTPLILHVGTLNESSIYGYLGAISFYAILYGKTLKKSDQSTYLNTTILSLLAFLRITNFVYLYAYLALLLLDCLRNKHENQRWRNFGFNVLISLSFLPLLLDAVVFGTPATDGVDIHALVRYYDYFNFYNSIELAYLTIFSTLSPLWTIGLALLISSLCFSKTRLLTIIMIFVLVCQITLFFSIDSDLISELRYKAEYFYPFCALGFVQVFINLEFFKDKKIFSLVVSFIACVVIVINFRTFSSYPQSYKDLAADTIWARSSEIVWDYSSALQLLLQREAVENMLIAGQTNGTLLQTMAGFTTKQMMSHKRLRDNYLLESKGDWLNYDLTAISSMKKIKYVVVTDIANRNEIIDGLLKNDWELIGSEPISFDKIVIIKRKALNGH